LIKATVCSIGKKKFNSFSASCGFAEPWSALTGEFGTSNALRRLLCKDILNNFKINVLNFTYVPSASLTFSFSFGPSKFLHALTASSLTKHNASIDPLDISETKLSKNG
jgi:hypothetical protein